MFCDFNSSFVEHAGDSSLVAKLTNIIDERKCLVMSPLAKDFENKESKLKTHDFLLFLQHISKQTQQIEKSISQHVNREIIKNIHGQYDKVSAVKSYIRVLKNELYLNKQKMCHYKYK